LAWVSNSISAFFINISDNQFLLKLYSIFYELFSFLGIVVLAYGIWVAIKDKKILIEKLKTLAYFDPITKLPNKNMILSSCPIKDTNKSKCQRKSTCVCKDRTPIVNLNKKCGLFFIDIDDFKLINDNLGHHYGDMLLEEIAIRLKNHLSNDDLIVHLSGDEFLIISYDSYLEEDLKEKSKGIINEISKSFILLNKEVHISCSVGTAVYPDNGSIIDDVVKKADIAMYYAKGQGKNQYTIYQDNMEKFFNKRFDYITDLKNALSNNNFVVHYQTKANTSDGKITGLEALVRWNHPEKGLIYPNDFITLAEEIGVISDVDIYVLNVACKQIQTWDQEGKKPYNISVNISPLLFNQSNFIAIFDHIISKYNIDSSYISIEITENIALQNIFQTQLKIVQLKERNIKVNLDDFGKGYSSLAYLKEYPIDYLKIDKIFIDDIINNKVDQALVNTIVQVSTMLGIKIIFEGVETKEQLDILKNIGTNEYQGYFLSKPKPIEEIELDFTL